jgi:peptidoglycan/LPS O-acetylase OafA/YrhL
MKVLSHLTSNSEIRDDLQGIRAIAVLSVIFYHCHFGFAKGGYIGVDVFFVLSGYLIMNVISAEISKGLFSIKRFYERRARRIFPALFVMLITTIPIAWVLLSPNELEDYSRSLLSTPFFISNLVIGLNTGYFETSADIKPLIHMWSLAVEEQFYLAVPILVLFLKAGKRKAVFWFFSVGLFSLLVAQFGSIYRPIMSFYILPTRAWELIIGVLVSFLPRERIHKFVNPVALNLLAICGIGLVLFSTVGFTNRTPFPSFYALTPTVGTALLIIFSGQNIFVGKLIGNILLRFIGTISYSAYLWHQPIFAFSRFVYDSERVEFKVLGIAVSMLLGWLSWRFVEQPFRNIHVVRKKTFNLMVAFSVALISIIGWTSISGLNSGLDFGTERNMAVALSTSESVFAGNFDERLFVKYRIEGENTYPSGIIIGSSRLMQTSEINLGSSRLQNLSVSSASINDMIAISSLAFKKYHFDTLYLGIDPWIFGSTNSDYWESLESEFYTAVKSLNISYSDNVIKSEDPISNLWSHLFVDLYRAINLERFGSVDSPSPYRDKILRDGSRIYVRYNNEIAQSDVQARFRVPLDEMKRYVFSPRRYELFSDFVSKFKLQAKVVFILTPLHPELYKLMEKTNPNYLRLETELKKFSIENGVELIGSYNPGSTKCLSSEFYDGIHPIPSCMKKFLSEWDK